MVKDHSDSEKGNPLPPHRLSYQLTARVLLYAPSHRQDNTYHGLCYTSRGALAGTRNSSMGPTTHRTMSERSTSELRPAPSKRGSHIRRIGLESTFLDSSHGHCEPVHCPDGTQLLLSAFHLGSIFTRSCLRYLCP